jgi:hypothetical protein
LLHDYLTTGTESASTLCSPFQGGIAAFQDVVWEEEKEHEENRLHY